MKREKSQAQTRRANRGNVPGFLGMAELQRLSAPKARPPWDERLLNYGYAPGGYIIKCSDCQQQVWECDKRAARCEPCATQRLNDDLRMYQGLT